MDFSGIDPPNGSLGRGVAIVEVVNHVKFTSLFLCCLFIFCCIYYSVKYYLFLKCYSPSPLGLLSRSYRIVVTVRLSGWPRQVSGEIELAS